MSNERIPAPLLALREHLASVPPGKVKDPASLIAVLEGAWGYLDGTGAQATHARKLDRIEDPEWDPPQLTFTLERHGRTLGGSTRADLHVWTVDVAEATATCEQGGYRQLYPQSPRLNVRPLADEVAGVIAEGAEHEWIEWLGADHFRVRISKVIPDIASKQAVQARRNRFRAALEPKLKEMGWQGGYNEYTRRTGV